jgi:polar amino acid transport system permease protein
MKPSRSGHPAAELAAALFLTALVCSIFWIILADLEFTRSSAALWKYRESLLQGWWVTLVVSAGSLLGSCLVAALLVTGQRSGLRAIRWFTQGFVEVVRGMPLLSLVLIGFYVVLNNKIISDALEHLGLGGKLFSGILLLSVFTGAYLTEILRGGLESIPQAQLESARAVGFNRWQVMRYVVFPQALRRVLPALAGQFVSLVKDSSLLCVIGVNEFTYQARAFYAATYLGVEAFLPLAVGYLLLTLPIAGFSHWLERRFKAATAS